MKRGLTWRKGNKGNRLGRKSFFRAGAAISDDEAQKDIEELKHIMAGKQENVELVPDSSAGDKEPAQKGAGKSTAPATI